MSREIPAATARTTSPGGGENLTSQRPASCAERKKGWELRVTAAPSQIFPGRDLLSHRVPPAVPLALEDLTSEFGMGSGVAPPVRRPETCCHRTDDESELRDTKPFDSMNGVTRVSRQRLHVLPTRDCSPSEGQEASPFM